MIPANARESLWLAPDGHRVRRIDWPAARGARGSILFLPGRADFYEKYLEALAHWAGRGWAVTAADWRGQGGSGRLGADAVTGHVSDFRQWVDDLAALWRAWIAETPPPHVLAGHSMGAHLILRAAADGRIAPQAIALSAPMLGLPGRMPPALMHAAARAMASVGDDRRPGWKWGEKPGEPPAARADLLTHDAERYADELWWRAERPEVVMGPGSWGWVAAAYASMRALASPGVLERVATPTLILASTADRLVAYRAIFDATRRLPDCDLVTFGEEARHEILREADPVRIAAQEAIDRFLDRAAGAA